MRTEAAIDGAALGDGAAIPRAPADIPHPRGPLSAALIQRLLAGDPAPDLPAMAARRARTGTTVVSDDDVQLSLHLLYRLHLDGLPGVDDGLEWAADLVATAAMLEAPFEADLRQRCRTLLAELIPSGGSGHQAEPASVRRLLQQITDADLGPSLSGYVASRAVLPQVRELLMLKSLYQLKEADPHTFAVPRVHGQAKAGLIEIQSDEYGNGQLSAMHAALFADAMHAAGLDGRPGAYLNRLPAEVLAADNAAMMFGLHRRLRGAVLGHLAALEMTSSLPMRRYARGIGRVGLPETAVAYFTEHVLADAVHEQVAVHDMVLPFLAANPTQLDEVLLGASTAVLLDALVAQATVTAWKRGESALLPVVSR